MKTILLPVHGGAVETRTHRINAVRIHVNLHFSHRITTSTARTTTICTVMDPATLNSRVSEMLSMLKKNPNGRYAGVLVSLVHGVSVDAAALYPTVRITRDIVNNALDEIARHPAKTRLCFSSQLTRTPYEVWTEVDRVVAIATIIVCLANHGHAVIMRPPAHANDFFFYLEPDTIAPARVGPPPGGEDGASHQMLFEATVAVRTLRAEVDALRQKIDEMTRERQRERDSLARGVVDE